MIAVLRGGQEALGQNASLGPLSKKLTARMGQVYAFPLMAVRWRKSSSAQSLHI